MTENQDPFDPLREFVYLHAEKKRLKAELDEIQAKLNEVESQAVNRMADEGFNKIRLDSSVGAVTVYLHNTVRASAVTDKDRDSIGVELATCGDPELECLVQPTFNLNTVSRVVRDYVGGGEELPPVLARNFNITERAELRVRKS